MNSKTAKLISKSATVLASRIGVSKDVAEARLKGILKGLPQNKRAKFRALLKHEVRYAPKPHPSP